MNSDLTKLAQLSRDFDFNRNRLQRALEDDCVIEDEREATSEALTKLSEAVDRVEQEVRLLRGAISSFDSNSSVSAINDRLEAALNRKSTPQPLLPDPSTPTREISTCTFEEEFPTTPTLEQLGLSGPTLSIVGRRVGYDSSTSLSDAEFDTSFYQNKSPAGHGMDNSFSSDVSVPQFRILHSSPSDKSSRRSNRRSSSANNENSLNSHNSHNLKQVTTVLTDFSDSSFTAGDSDAPSGKRVHFSEDVENMMEN